MNANVFQMNRLEKTGICVHEFVTKNSLLKIFTGCNMHTQSTTNHIHTYLKMLVLISFIFLLQTLLNTKKRRSIHAHIHLPYKLRSPFFWHVTLHHWLIGSQCFMMMQQSHLQGSTCLNVILLGHFKP